MTEINLKELKKLLKSKGYAMSDYLLGKYLQNIDRQHIRKEMLSDEEDEKQEKDVKKEIKEAFAILPELMGTEDVLDKAQQFAISDKAKAAIERLRQINHLLCRIERHFLFALMCLITILACQIAVISDLKRNGLSQNLFCPYRFVQLRI